MKITTFDADLFQLDYYCEACSLKRTGKGIEADKTIEIQELN